jgi:hypothetical protein
MKDETTIIPYVLTNEFGELSLTKVVTRMVSCDEVTSMTYAIDSKFS